ncbi:MAG TPA: ABC transporter substrate-binding protein [Casimicrobiaceae bacterium]|jgi:peptide/nickel transport system substrate-binding protein|nr:ABC transporter substrate-binding protein [Casimicrobiaceae bacterium]
MKHLATMVGLAGALLLAAALPADAQKVLNVGMAAADLGSLDPHRTATTPDKAVIGWMFNGLVRFKPGTMNPDQIEPDLAQSWDTSADQLTWTFHLRKGVQCNNGYGELSADDVVFSLKRAADPKISSFSSDYADVASVDAVDPATVKITFKRRPPSVLGILTNYQGGNIVCKKAVEKLGDDFRTKAVGTGPFAIENYTPSQSLTLVANKNYFRGAPKIDRIVYRYIQSDATRDLAYTSGEIDLIYGRQDQVWAERMKSLPNTVVDVFGPGELSDMNLNITKKPLDDLRVRQAIAYAVNRAELVKFKGALTAREAVSIIPHDYLGTDENAPLYPYDPAKAKQLLTEAGYANGVKITLIQTQLPTMLNTMQVVQAQLKKVGIDLQLDVVDHPTFHAQIRKDLSPVVLYSAARLPVADVYLTQFYHSRSIVGTPSAVTNFSHCSVADQDIDAARQTNDVAKQKTLWKDAQDKLVKDVCAVPLYEQLQVWAHRDKLNYGYKLDASLTLGPIINEQSTLQ